MIALKYAPDPLVEQILSTLSEEYAKSHPRAKIDVYRLGTELIRIRVIDPDFSKQPVEARDRAIWEILDRRFDLETINRISLLLALTPSEVKRSGANREFENPTTSMH